MVGYKAQVQVECVAVAPPYDVLPCALAALTQHGNTPNTPGRNLPRTSRHAAGGTVPSCSRVLCAAMLLACRPFLPLCRVMLCVLRVMCLRLEAGS